MKTKLTAIAAGVSFALISGSASALSLGSVWTMDQVNATLYVYDQAELNTDPGAATPTVVALDAGDGGTSRAHIASFSNHSGLDPDSRATLAYLGGQLQTMRSDDQTVVNTQLGTSGAGSLHMCGGNVDNTEMACSSLGARELSTISTDYANDIYGATVSYAIADMVISSSVKGKKKKLVEAVLADMDLPGTDSKPICNNYSSDGSLIYLTLTAGTKGVLVLDSADFSILDAIDATGNGCGLVNSPDGDSMWTNAGSKAIGDVETAMKWNFADARKKSPNSQGPAAIVVLDQTGGNGKGDVHGAQFAGLGGGLLWELMRLSDSIQVIDPDSATIVASHDLNALTGLGAVGGDVLDRSAFGTRMYFSSRGFKPTTAIPDNPSLARNPGVHVLSTVFGYTAGYVGVAEIRSGNIVGLCLANDDGDAHDHMDPNCPAGQEEFLVDNADPHGLKSLSNISGF